MKTLKAIGELLHGLALVAVVVGVLFAAATAWDHFKPNLALRSVGPAAAPLPVVAPPVQQTVRWKTQVVTRTVTREVPAPKDQAAAESRFHLVKGELSGRDSGHSDLLADVKLPVAPYGSEAIVTQDQQGKTAVTVVANKRPWFELGGIRETGLSYDLIHGDVGLYHQQDLLRTGPVVWSLRGFASTGTRADAGTFNYGVEARAGVRW